MSTKTTVLALIAELLNAISIYWNAVFTQETQTHDLHFFSIHFTLGTFSRNLDQFAKDVVKVLGETKNTYYKLEENECQWAAESSTIIRSQRTCCSLNLFVY